MEQSRSKKILIALFYLSFASYLFGISIHQGMVFLLFLTGVFVSVRERVPFARVYWAKVPAILLISAILISAMWNTYSHGETGEIKFHWAFLVFWMMDRDLIQDINWDKFLYILIICALPGMLRSFIWLLQPDEIAWALKVGFDTYPRAFGLNANPITHSEGLIVLTAWLLARLTAGVNEKKKRNFLLLILSVLLIITFSRVRSGWLAFIGISLIHALTYAPHRKIIGAFLMVLVLGFFVSLAIFGFNLESIYERQDLLLRGVHIFQDYPILGIGPDRFDLYPAIENGLTSHPHNTLVGIAAETGVVGLFFFLIFSVVLFRRSLLLFLAYRHTGTTLSWVTRALFYIIISFWIFGLSDYNFGSTEILIMHALHWAVIARIPMPARAELDERTSNLISVDVG